MNVLHVRVNSPEKIIWEGDALSVSSENVYGPFDVLPLHANFITVIENKPIVIRTTKGPETLTMEHAVLYAHSNTVAIYTKL